MSKFIKKLFGTLSDKPWQKEQMESDDQHQGKTFDISLQTSAVIVIFGVSTVLFTLVVTGYLYSIPASQDTSYLLKPNLLWLDTLILLFVAYFFNKITNDLMMTILTITFVAPFLRPLFSSSYYGALIALVIFSYFENINKIRV